MVTNDERQAFSARLNAALDAADVPPKFQGRQKAVAKRFGVSQKGARKWLEGEAIPETKRLPQIAADLGVSVEWLLMGGETATSLPGRDPRDRKFSQEDLRDALSVLRESLPPQDIIRDEASDVGLYPSLDIRSNLARFTPAPSGGEQKPTLGQLLAPLADRLASVDPSLREEVSRLMLRYLDTPTDGRILRALEELLGHNANPSA
jgi:transcriptional regulator with XRE-family HTH domain